MRLPVRISLSTAAVSISFMLFLFYNMHQQLVTLKKESTVQGYIKDLQNLKDKTDLILSRAKNTLSLITIANLNDKQLDKKLKIRFESYIKNIPEISQLKYISIDGKELVIVSSEKLFFKKNSRSYLNDDNFVQALKDDFFISNLYFTDKYNEMVVDVSRKVLDINSGDVIGVIIAKISMSSIQDMISDKLVNFDAIVLIDTNTNKFLYKSSQAQNIDKKVFFNDNTGIEFIKHDNKQYLMACENYKNHQLNMKFCLLVNKDSVLSDINKIIQDNLMLLVILILIFLLIMLLFISYIFKPLTKLTNSIKNLSIELGEDIAHEVDSDNEIEKIKVYFTQFVKLINQERDKLRDFNTNLQCKIDEEVKKNQQTQKQLMQQAKMVSMGEMIGNIAHQWRQPLSVISALSTGTKFKKEYAQLSDEEFVKNMDTINNNAQYLSKTIDDFRNFIKGERKLKLFNFEDNIDNFLHLVEGLIKNNHIDIKLELEENIELNSYPNELIQCFINIFNNAKDAFKGVDDEHRLFFISSTKKDDKIFIKLKDSAGGIPDDILPKIFDPYFTTKHQSQGTGLGLNMTYKLITEGLGGYIEAHNVTYEYNDKIYTGAEFIITIPLNCELK